MLEVGLATSLALCRNELRLLSGDGGGSDDGNGNRDPLPEVETDQPKKSQKEADKETPEPGNIVDMEDCKCCWLSGLALHSFMKTVRIVSEATSAPSLGVARDVPFRIDPDDIVGDSFRHNRGSGDWDEFLNAAVDAAVNNAGWNVSVAVLSRRSR